LHDETIEKIKALRVEDMTPLELLMELQQLRDEIVKKEKK